MMGRLGKEAAEIALRFLADGMRTDDAIRAGAALADEPLSKAAETLARQQGNIADRTMKAGLAWGKTPDEVEELVTQGYRPETFKQFVGSDMAMASNPWERRRWTDELMESGDIAGAGRGYAIRQLLMDASGGDENMAAMLAKRLGFEGLL